MNKIIDDLNWRYTTKSFDASKKISEEQLNIFYESLRLCASSINSQPWKFIVIESDSAKKRMEDTFQDPFLFNKNHIANSHVTILFAYNPEYKKSDFEKVIDKNIADKRITLENKEKGMSKFFFVDLYKTYQGKTIEWSKCQLYIALGNALHTLARLKIDSTAMEGIDTDAINATFSKELDGYLCNFALSIGYRKDDDFNANIPKSRLKISDIITHI